jgi:hypothetical protein
MVPFYADLALEPERPLPEQNNAMPVLCSPADTSRSSTARGDTMETSHCLTVERMGSDGGRHRRFHRHGAQTRRAIWWSACRPTTWTG